MLYPEITILYLIYYTDTNISCRCVLVLNYHPMGDSFLVYHPMGDSLLVSGPISTAEITTHVADWSGDQVTKEYSVIYPYDFYIE